MPRLTRQTRLRSSEPNNSTPPDSIEVIDNRYVTIEAFNTMLQEVQLLRSLVQGRTVNNEEPDTSDGISSSSNTVVSDFGINHGMVKSIYDNISHYSGDGDMQKLLDFINKVNNYLAIANTMPAMEIALITMKLTGTASLLWRHHKRMYDALSPNRIQTWKGLHELLMQNKVTKEQERHILSQLDKHTQKDSVQKYTNEFERYTMQLIDLPLTIEMHYYLKGLKIEIRQLVESNELNLTCMTTLKNACLRQDHIMSPPPGNDKNTPKTNEESIALMASNTRGKHNYKGGYSQKGPTNRGGYNADKRGESDNKRNNTDPKDSSMHKP
jgi:hypothetical protein